MNFVKFSVGDTNVFPMANSTAGGQLLSEFNIRSRESIGTPQAVKYMIGPSYTHCQEDFTVSFEIDSTGTVLSKQHIQISEGRAIVNGHFVESLAPAIIDLVAANAQIQAENRGLSPDNKKSLLKGELAIGLRVMYSTEMTTSGSLLTEDEDGMYMGVQIVILPKDEFFTPEDKPEDPNAVTAHLLLGTFKFVNNVISNIKQNPEKVQMISADRIGDVDKFLSSVYVTKTGLNPRHHYVYTTKGPESAQGLDTWCEADESLMVWDAHPVSSPGALHSEEAHFEYDSTTDKTNLVMPHKQIDGPELSTTDGTQEYFLDKVISLPTANYARNTGGVVDRSYTDNVKQVVNKLQKLYMLPNGRMRLYLDTLDSRSDLPDLNKEAITWQPGDYVVVGRDSTSLDEINADTPPSTIYMVLPGKVTGLTFVETRSKKLESLSGDTSWNSMIISILSSIDWRTTIRNAIQNTPAGNIFSVDWNTVVREKILGLPFLNNTNWAEVITNAVDKYRDVDNVQWETVITEAWSKAYQDYTTVRAQQLQDATAKLTAAKEAYETASINYNDAVVRQTAYNDLGKAYDDARIDIRALEKLRQFSESSDWEDLRGRSSWSSILVPEVTLGKVTLHDGTAVTGLLVFPMADNPTPKTDNWYTLSTEQKTENLLLKASNKQPVSESSYQTVHERYVGYEAAAKNAFIPAKKAYQEGMKVFEALGAKNLAKSKLDAAQQEYNAALEGQEVAEELFNEGRYFPTADLAEAIAASIDLEGINWTEFLIDALAEGISDTSEIEWSNLIADNIEASSDAAQIPWDTIIPQALLEHIKNNHIEYDYMDQQLPESLKNKGGIEISRATSDRLIENVNTAKSVLGITDDQGYLIDDRPAGRVGVDYFRIIYTDESTNTVYHSFFTPSETSQKTYIDPPILLTGGVPYAQEDVVGGFLNVPESQLGAGYVYRNENGYLQLLDYDLLASGVLAYQLGEDFNCPAGLSSGEIQSNLDEYVNNRVAFPNANQLASSLTPYVIHVYVNLSREDIGYEISLNNIDSRFNTVVYLHVSGESSTSCILNIIKCQKLRLDLNVIGGITVNLVDTELYYDADILDKIEHISGLKLWYDRFTADEPNLLVQGMSVEYVGTPSRVSNEEYWTVDSPNDNHYSYALKGITFDHTGHIVGAKMYVTDDITGNIEDGSYISTFEFKFPQSLGLPYPSTKISKSIKVTGAFVTAYPGPRETGYIVKDTKFTALSYGVQNITSLSGVISFKTDVSHVERVFGIGAYGEGLDLLPNIDSWTTGSYHVFEGGTID